MDKTYAEACCVPSFDWRKALQEAITKEPSRETCFDLSKRARNWVTCACGNQCAIIERDPIGGPRDVILKSLGLRFMDSIGAENWREALFKLEQIEERSAILIHDALITLQANHPEYV